MGYETIGNQGYRERFEKKARELGIADRVQWVATVSTRDALLKLGSTADIGLALMPLQTTDVNMQSMVGASNKAFDYLACGIPLLISNLPAWRQTYAEPGFAQVCDPADPASIARTLKPWIDSAAARQEAGEKGRQKILSDWNYERQFAPVLQRLETPAVIPTDFLNGLETTLVKIPDGTPGKTRLARLGLRRILDRPDETLRDRWNCRYVAPSLREPIAFHLLINRVYEADPLRMLFEVLRPGAVFVDVGANIGIYSMPLAKHVGPRGKVIAIEASPKIFRYLERNAVLNGLTNVIAHEKAASSATGMLQFYEAPANHFGMGSVLAQFGAAPISVPAARLDDLLAADGIDHVDAIKLDIEGSEAAALEGASALLHSAQPPLVLFEYNAARDHDQQAEKKLKDFGFRIRTIPDFLAGRPQRDLTRGSLDMLVADKR